MTIFQKFKKEANVLLFTKPSVTHYYLGSTNNNADKVHEVTRAQFTKGNRALLLSSGFRTAPSYVPHIQLKQ